jgi:hypothetical protein
MKTALISLLVATAMISTGAALVEPESSSSQLSHKQANELLQTASTPEAHLQLARYFRQEAQKNRDKEARDLETARTYRLHPPRVDMYRNMSISETYRYLANEAHQLALADDQLAGAHNQMALQLMKAK